MKSKIKYCSLFKRILKEECAGRLPKELLDKIYITFVGITGTGESTAQQISDFGRSGFRQGLVITLIRDINKVHNTKKD